MGQDWKTLSVVVIAAAVVGWLMVRALGDNSSHRVPSSPATVTAIPGPQPTAETPVATPTEAPPPVQAPIPPAANAPAASDGSEAALIEHDLELLSQGLAKDQRIEERVMPRVNDALDVPGVIAYRRAADFWDPAFGRATGANP